MVPGWQIPVLRSVPRSGGSLERKTERKGKTPGELLRAWTFLTHEPMELWELKGTLGAVWRSTLPP